MAIKPWQFNIFVVRMNLSGMSFDQCGSKYHVIMNIVWTDEYVKKLLSDRPTSEIPTDNKLSSRIGVANISGTIGKISYFLPKL